MITVSNARSLKIRFRQFYLVRQFYRTLVLWNNKIEYTVAKMLFIYINGALASLRIQNHIYTCIIL